jgi:transposase-like protein
MDQATLKSVFSYNPQTGAFIWNVDQPPHGRVGKVAGYQTHGYIKISYKGKKYYSHRLAFLYMTGSIPKEIDHINQCGSDNRWENLRESDRVQNTSNIKGRRGVRMRHGRWYARHGKGGHIGVFDTEQEARDAYIATATKKAGKHPDDTSLQIPQDVSTRKSNAKKYDGKTVSELARQHGIPQPTLHYRLHNMKMPLEQALKPRMTKCAAVVGHQMRVNRPDG